MYLILKVLLDTRRPEIVTQAGKLLQDSGIPISPTCK